MNANDQQFKAYIQSNLNITFLLYLGLKNATEVVKISISRISKNIIDTITPQEPSARSARGIHA